MLFILVVFVLWTRESLLFFFFFFKQKTAYELRISDWSSDVCSSDLDRYASITRVADRGSPLSSLIFERRDRRSGRGGRFVEEQRLRYRGLDGRTLEENGRASCRERVCQYV